MARTPEQRGQRKKIAREFREQFLKQPGRKALQRAASDRSGLEEPPQRSPRGPGLPHRLVGENWLHMPRYSREAQANIAHIVHEGVDAWDRRKVVSDRLKDEQWLSTIVGDASVILHGIGYPGLPACRDVVDLVKQERVGLVVTDPIINELYSVAQTPRGDIHFDSDQLDALDCLLSQFAINVSCLIDGDGTAPEIVKEDPSDTKYVTALLIAQAEYLVSRDRHLLNYEPLDQDNLPIINPLVFLNIIRRRF